MIAMSTKLKQGKVGDRVRAITKICRLKDIRSYMTFPELDKTKEVKMAVFTDASFGRPKAALLLWFFGDFRCGALLFVVIHVIYKYKNR